MLVAVSAVNCALGDGGGGLILEAPTVEGEPPIAPAYTKAASFSPVPTHFLLTSQLCMHAGILEVYALHADTFGNPSSSADLLPLSNDKAYYLYSPVSKQRTEISFTGRGQGHRRELKTGGYPPSSTRRMGGALMQ